jgi:hypothetical protein
MIGRRWVQITLVGFCVAATALACSATYAGGGGPDDDAGTVGADAKGTDDVMQAGIDGSVSDSGDPTDDSSTQDSGAPTDAQHSDSGGGRDAASDSAAATGMRCGTANCAGASDGCCSNAPMGYFTPVCQAAPLSCTTGLACDDSNDCAGIGQKCCGQTTGVAAAGGARTVVSSLCLDACPLLKYKTLCEPTSIGSVGTCPANTFCTAVPPVVGVPHPGVTWQLGECLP